MKQFKRSMAVLLTFLMVLTAVPVNTYAAAAKKQPTAATKITKPSKVTVVAGKSKSVKLTLNKKAEKKVCINVKSSNKKIAKVTKSTVTVAKGKKVSGAFVVKGVKKGTAKVTVSFKNKKGTSVKKVITVTVTKKTVVDDTEEDTKDDTKVTESTVATQAEVTEALANADLKKLTISTQATEKIVLSGAHAGVDLVVNAPNATIENSATWKSVTIQAIAPNTWIEKAIGNAFTVVAKIAHIVVSSGAKINNIIIATPAGTKTASDVVKVEAQAGAEVAKVVVATASVKVETVVASASAKVGTVEVSAAKAEVKVTGTTTEAVKVTVTASATEAKVEANTKVEVSNSAKDTKVELNSGSAGSTVKTETTTASTITDNKSGGDIKVSDKDGKDTTVNNNATATTTTGTDGNGSTNISNNESTGTVIPTPSQPSAPVEDPVEEAFKASVGKGINVYVFSKLTSGNLSVASVSENGWFITDPNGMPFANAKDIEEALYKNETILKVYNEVDCGGTPIGAIKTYGDIKNDGTESIDKTFKDWHPIEVNMGGERTTMTELKTAYVKVGTTVYELVLGGVQPVFEGVGSRALRPKTRRKSEEAYRAQLKIAPVASEPTPTTTKTDLKEATITVGELTYTGAVLTPIVTVKVGNTALNTANYTLEFKKGTEAATVRDAGEYTVFVTAKKDSEQYTGSKSAEFTVAKAENALTPSVNGLSTKAESPTQLTIEQTKNLTFTATDGVKTVTYKKQTSKDNWEKVEDVENLVEGLYEITVVVQPSDNYKGISEEYYVEINGEASEQGGNQP